MPSTTKRNHVIASITALCLLVIFGMAIARSVASNTTSTSPDIAVATGNDSNKAAHTTSAYLSQDSTESASFRFVVMGDSRGSTKGVNESVLRTIMRKVKKLSPQPKFVFFVGDMVGGGLRVAHQLDFWKDIMDDYYPIEAIYPVIGNHEGNESVFSKEFTYLPDETIKGYGRTVYRLNYGNADFFVLNSNRKHEITAAERNWLDMVLKHGKKHLHFVFFHEPAYPTGSHFGSSLDHNRLARDKFWTVLDANNITLAFVGHEHDYARRHIDSAMNETVNGTRFSYKHKIYQITNGSAGAPPTSRYKSKTGVDVPPKAVYNYSVVDVSGGKVSLKVYDIKDRLIDKFVVGN